MGSFAGHMYKGLVFILVAWWWIINACRQYIQSRHNGTPLVPKMSYSVRCKREIPVEIIFKILFTIAGFISELLDGGTDFLDEHGNFGKVVYAQHMTIYGLFVLHSFIDLLTWLDVPIVPGGVHASAALSFLWYGVAFYKHSQLHGRQPLEVAVHLLPCSSMVVAGGALLLELMWRQGVWTLMARSLGVLTMGTWWFHVAFMLYKPDAFPGNHHSSWDRSDPRNVQYARASFGLHILFNMLFILLCYVIAYVIARLRHKGQLDVTSYDRDRDDAVTLRLCKARGNCDSADRMLMEDSA